jgi:hypothetical protein
MMKTTMIMASVYAITRLIGLDSPVFDVIDVLKTPVDVNPLAFGKVLPRVK